MEDVVESVVETMKAIPTMYVQTNANTFVMGWVRRYFMALGLIALGSASWKYKLFIHSHEYGGRNSFQMWVMALDAGSYFLTVILLLCPWWRFSPLIAALGYAIVLPSCTYVIAGLSVADLVYIHQQTAVHLLLLSGLLAEILWLFLRLRAESRQATIAHLWKQRLRQKHQDKIELVERFILEIEDDDRDILRGSRFADISGNDDPTAMWERLDAEWKRWLNR